MTRLVFVAFLASFAGLLALPETKSTENEYKVVCYYGSWASHRNGEGNFQVEDVDVSLCTHLVYTFAGIHHSTYEIVALDPELDLETNNGRDAYRRATGLRNANPKLKVLLAIGGWNEGSAKYSQMASDLNKRQIFINSVVNMLETYGFDGLDIDWEYPGSRGGAVIDKQNLIVLLEELRQEFDPRGWLLTIAVGMGVETIDYGYNIPAVSQHVDFINMMTYDFRSHWDGKTGHHTQMFPRTVDTGNTAYHNLNSSVNLWIDGGAQKSKLVLGLALFGKTYKVLHNTGELDVVSEGAGLAGEYTQTSGYVGYNELCTKLVNEVWNVDTDEVVRSPWAYKDDQWIAFDNVASVTEKSNWAKELGLGGAMAWSIETDDFHGLCGEGNFPLLKAINSVFRDGATIPPQGPTNAVKNTSPNPFYEDCNSETVGLLKADPDDCASYYQCAPHRAGAGLWIHQSCPHDLYYNEDVMGCDYSTNVECHS